MQGSIDFDQVQRFAEADRCVLVVDGDVLDVTDWAASHPGGPELLHSLSGKDATCAFHSYHPPDSKAVRCALKACRIGRVAPAPPARPREALAEANGGSLDRKAIRGFYTTLQRRVDAYFKENKLARRGHTLLYAKTVAILALASLSYRVALFPNVPRPVQFLSAALLGVCMGWIGICIQHDGNHGSYSSSQLVRRAAGITLDLGGCSSYIWTRTHNMSHHIYTNTSKDPDICVSQKDIRRFSTYHPLHWFHRFQYIYLPVLYGILSFKSHLVEDFRVLLTGEFGGVQIGRPKGFELALFISGKIYFFGIFFAVPYLLGVEARRIALCFITAEVFSGYMLAFIFQVAHVADGVHFWPEEEEEGKPFDKDVWAVRQLMSTSNFAPGSALWTHITGGLNHQVEHHLFPGISHTHYPAISRIVRDACLEHGVPYLAFPSFWEAVKAHIRWLKKLGTAKASCSMSLYSM
eukprot:tig00000981_g5876.t1